MKTVMKPLAVLAFCGVSALALSAASAQQSQGQANPPTKTDSPSQGAPTLGIGEKTGVNSMLGITPSTTDFVKEAATSDMFEIQSSQEALKRGDQDAKTYAQKMIDDHMKTTNEIKSMVQSKNIKVEMPTAMAPSQQSMLDNLRNMGNGGNAGASGTMNNTAAKGNSGTSTGAGTVGVAGTANNSGAGAGSGAGANSGNTAADFSRRYFDDQITSHKDAVSLYERYSKGGDNADLKAYAEKTLPNLRDHLKMAQDMSGKYGNSGNRSGANNTGGAGSGAMGAGGAGMGTTGRGTTGTGSGAAGNSGAGGGAGTTTGR